MPLAKLDEATSIYRDSVMPAAKQQKGFKGLYVLADHKTGKGLTIALWESEADMMAGEQSGYYQQQVAKFKDILSAPPVREAYEVTVHS
jgi:heme-degrading monooxygenase HmoA